MEFPFRQLRIFKFFYFVFVTFMYSAAIDIDNHFVAAQADCFDRIALGAMLPFDKTFRNSETNSLKVCQEMCLREGERCNTISFGITVRGNGTCQLTEQKFDGTQKRPTGTIFDPDFDLYQRRTNCFTIQDPESDLPPPGVFSQSPPATNLRPSPPPFGSITPMDEMPTIITGRPQLPPTYASDPPITDDRFTSGGPPSTESRYPTTSGSSYPSPGYEVTETENTHRFPTSPPTLANNPTDPSANNNQNTVYYSHDPYPVYKYPMLYEQNYPMPNGRPPMYAPNAPVIYTRYTPSYPSSYSNGINETNRPYYGVREYGNGYSYGTPVRYGNGYSYGTPVKNGASTSPPSSYPKLNYDTRPMPAYGVSERPTPPSYSQDTRPSPGYVTNDNRPSSGYTPADPRPQPGYTNNYDPPRPQTTFSDQRLTTGYGSDSTRPPEYYPNSQRPDNRPVYDRPDRPYDPSQRPTPGQTPGYVIPLSPTSSSSITPGYDPTSSTAGAKSGNRYPYDELSFACFRRVLAGKRVAPHWVRRTLACERVEDCMQECGHEKRFTCEGFNYRLDPSGHGQGDCELVEVPLAEMGLYSSTQSRDSNLLRHPDYDYYERDRNAPTSCKPSPCVDCGVKPYSPPSYYRPESHRPYDSDIPSSGYGTGPEHYRPKDPVVVDRYRPRPPVYDSRPVSYPARPHPPPHVYETRPPPDYPHPFSSSGSGGYRPSYGAEVDRHDISRPDDSYRPGTWQVHVSTIHDAGYGIRDHRPPPLKPTGHGTIYEIHDPLPPPSGPESHKKPLGSPEYYTPPYRPDSRPYDHHDGYYRPPSHDYLDRDRPQKSPQTRFVPYSIGDSGWGTYAVRYGDKTSQGSYGMRNENRRKDTFDYFQLGDHHGYHGDNTIWSYPGSKYDDKFAQRPRPDYGSQWIRRPGEDDCSVKLSEGFRLNKGVIRTAYTVPTVTECERMCNSENGFTCQTYSYRYSQPGRENCQLCDRPYNNLDYYHDVEPDRDFDIYSMSDDRKACHIPSGPPRGPTGPTGTAVGYPRQDTSAQCFFRAIDATRFTKPIVRDSLNVRSVGECEMECIKSTKFTCRAFAFRYGQRKPGGIIDNCQLSDWPVRDMDKTRHLESDPSFDIFERASYGHGCEIQPIIDDKHKKLCYLGYGSPAKLLSSAIKKVISCPTELDCKHECIRYRENTPFKCYSFSYGSRASTFNCEMSDLDQSELKLNIHYTHTHGRDNWLFAWNPFDWTCRDKIITIGGDRVNNDRRMDIFREPGGVAWRHYTVSGKPCRLGSGCDKNIVSGFYSCEIDGGEVGSWDYCCRSDHPCGYSQGFEYPWCFVGDEFDQWRKCSDRYYPGLASDSQQIITITHLNNKTKPEFQKPPRPGGLQNIDDINVARLWPVTYVYTEGPPNSTELSNFVDCNKENC